VAAVAEQDRPKTDGTSAATEAVPPSAGQSESEQVAGVPQMAAGEAERAVVGDSFWPVIKPNYEGRGRLRAGSATPEQVRAAGISYWR
jgi:hypothetical protein